MIWNAGRGVAWAGWARSREFSNLHSKGQISLETLLGLLKKGEIFDDEFSIDAELKKVEAEFQKQSAPPVVDPAAMG